MAGAGEREAEEDACLVALSGLPGIGPSRLLAVLQAGEAVEAWRAVGAGRAHHVAAWTGRLGKQPAQLAASWAAAAREVEPAHRLAEHREAGIAVRVLGRPGYPELLANDPHPPAVLFSLGGLDALDAPRVAIVGTRNATRVGREVAHELGWGLAAAGVSVVSGLALGVDGAAHRGALHAPHQPGGEGALFDADALRPEERGRPVGVVAAGLDIAYPRSHRQMHLEVAEQGLLLSEAPMGQRPEPWRFPARNRIIAGLVDLVVVVESRHSGGSMLTAGAALDRGIQVAAVPGSVREPASAGTNDLLAEGALPVRDVDDVLVAIGRGGARRPPRSGRALPADPVDRAVLEQLGWAPATFARLADDVDHPLTSVAAAVARLEADGWIERTDGWLERVGRRRG